MIPTKQQAPINTSRESNIINNMELLKVNKKAVLGLEGQSALVLPWSVCAHKNTVAESIWVTLHILHVGL